MFSRLTAVPKAWGQLKKLFRQVLVNFLLPVGADGSRKLLGRDGNTDVHQIHVLVLCHQLGFKFPVYQLVKIPLDRGFVAQLQLMIFKIIDNVAFDGIADPVFKIV